MKSVKRAFKVGTSENNFSQCDEMYLVHKSPSLT